MKARPLANSERAVFIVRVWNRSAEETTWVGVIQHVGTGVVAHVRDARELVDYLNGQFEEQVLPAQRLKGLQ